MATQGMDPSVVRAAADEMDLAASSLHALIGSINGTVGRMSAGWFGPDIEQLVHQWQRVSRPTVEALAVQTHDLASRARQQAHDQDVASGTAGSAGGAAAPPGGGVNRARLPLATRELLGRIDNSLLGLALGVVGGAELLAKVAQLGAGATKATLSNLARFNQRFGKLELGGSLTKDALKAANKLGFALDAYDIANDIAAHRNPTGSIVNTVVDFVATKNVYVATGKTTYDVTHFVLTETGPGREFVDTQNDMALAEGRKAVGGDPTSPQAAQHLVDRYEGVPGFLNFVGDSGKSLVNGGATMVNDAGEAWNRFWSRR